MASADLLLLLLIALAASSAAADSIHGCGGFVQASPTLIRTRKASDAKLDYSHVTVELRTVDGLLKDRTQCAPNGYYFIPVYDKGLFVVKVAVAIDQNGCNANADINFQFTGFMISGKVKGAVGGDSCSLKDGGPPDLPSQNQSNDAAISCHESTSYVLHIQAYKSNLEVNLGFGNAFVDDIFFISGYDIRGFVVSQKYIAPKVLESRKQGLHRVVGPTGHRWDVPPANRGSTGWWAPLVTGGMSLRVCTPGGTSHQVRDPGGVFHRLLGPGGTQHVTPMGLPPALKVPVGPLLRATLRWESHWVGCLRLGLDRRWGYLRLEVWWTGGGCLRLKVWWTGGGVPPVESLVDRRWGASGWVWTGGTPLEMGKKAQGWRASQGGPSLGEAKEGGAPTPFQERERGSKTFGDGGPKEMAEKP
ncbi:hypothetical protein Taro_010967 [Colocasia esculenta]|uniref:NOMO-like N-terminal beta-sandwich domain-containing protein n=1 Tax=Colocasia esculenta TaxID=4460 RepID=A0A843UER6_COLES|nr:hypothetical protein [Colocasia esculenta]